MKIRCILVIAALFAFNAAIADDGVAWDALSAEQQEILGQFSENWSELGAERQQRLAHGADRWIVMSPEQRDAAQQRFARWQGLPTDRRSRIGVSAGPAGTVGPGGPGLPRSTVTDRNGDGTT